MTSARSTGPRRVAVAGGSGVVGRHVVAALSAAGHEPVPLSRSTGVDVVTGRGLAAALEGADAVVDVTSIATLRKGASVRFFEAATRALLDAEVPHVVALSIVGADRVRSGYYAGKLRQEEVLLGSGRPVTLLRSTQFHEFAGQLLERSRIGPLRPVPRMRVQPVAAAAVAAALAELAVGPAQGRVADLAGPDVHELVHLARRVATRGRVVPLPVPGSMRTGLLGGPGARVAGPTFDAWLAEQAPA